MPLKHQVSDKMLVCRNTFKHFNQYFWRVKWMDGACVQWVVCWWDLLPKNDMEAENWCGFKQTEQTQEQEIHCQLVNTQKPHLAQEVLEPKITGSVFSCLVSYSKRLCYWAKLGRKMCLLASSEYCLSWEINSACELFHSVVVFPCASLSSVAKFGLRSYFPVTNLCTSLLTAVIWVCFSMQ